MLSNRLSFRSRFMWTLLLTLIAFCIVSQIPAVTAQSGTLYESHNPGATPSSVTFSGGSWRAQGFKIGATGANENMIPTSISLHLVRAGMTPGAGTLTVSIRSSLTGSDDCVGTSDVSGWPINTNDWYFITLIDCSEIPADAVRYIIIRCANCGSSSYRPNITFGSINPGTYPANLHGNGSSYSSSNSGSSWSNANGDFNFFLHGETAVPPTPTPAPTPTPTVQPTPTPLPAGTATTIIGEYAATETCFNTIGANPEDIIVWVQPFTPDNTAQIASVNLRLTKFGTPSSLGVWLMNVPNSGTPTVDTLLDPGGVMAFGNVNLNNVSAHVETLVTANFTPQPQVEFGERYALAMFIDTQNSHANNVCIKADTEQTFNAGSAVYTEASEDLSDPDSYAIPDGSDPDIVFWHVINGYTQTSPHVPENPASHEPATTPPSAYEDYYWSWTNAYIGTPLLYEFATMTSDVTFLIRRLSEAGTPIQNLASYTVETNDAFFVHETFNQTQGPFEVYDVTNNVRLVKHYLLPEPHNAFKDDRPHREAADFAIGIGNVVNLSPTTATRRQHSESSPLHSMLEFRNYTFLHYRLPDTEDPNDVFVSIRNANSLVEVVRVSIAELAEYNASELGGTRFSDSIYFQNFVVLNTDGNNLPFVTNFGLIGVVGAILEPGVYNYALVDENDIVFSEGESLLLIVPQGLLVNPWQLQSERATWHLGQTARFTFTQRIETLFSVYKNFAITGCCGDLGVLLDTSLFRARQTISYTHPESWPNPLPATIIAMVQVAPEFLPYSTTPNAYRFNIATTYRLEESCGILCNIENRLRQWGVGGENDKMLLSFALLVGILALRIKVPSTPAVIAMAVCAFVLFAVIGWIPPAFIVLASVFLGLLVIALVLIGRRGGDD